MYRPLAQTFMFPMAFVVRTDGDPGAARGRRPAGRVSTIDPAVPVAELQPLTALIAGSLGRPRLLALLLSVFAAVGLALGIVGVYGVVAYRVRQQEREFGIRLALGAPRRRRFASSVLRQGAGYAAAGLLIGVPAAFGLAAADGVRLFGVAPHDPLTFIGLPASRRRWRRSPRRPPRPPRRAVDPVTHDAGEHVGRRPPSAGRMASPRCSAARWASREPAARPTAENLQRASRRTRSRRSGRVLPAAI